eukprot:g4141.t1
MFAECFRCRSTLNMQQTGRCFPCLPPGVLDAPRFTSETTCAQCWCLVFCTGSKVGTARLTHDLKMSDIYASLEKHDWSHGVPDCGPTRWGRKQSTSSLVLRQVSDGTLHAVFDVHDFLCCYNGTHCLTEGESMMLEICNRINSFLNEDFDPLNFSSSSSEGEDDDLYDAEFEARALVLAEAVELRGEEVWEQIESEPPPPGLNGKELEEWFRKNRRESHPEHPNHLEWRMKLDADKEAEEREAAGLEEVEGGMKPEDVDISELTPELRWKLLMKLDEYTTDKDLHSYYDRGSGIWNEGQLNKDLKAVQMEVKRKKREDEEGGAITGFASRMAQMEREKNDKTGKLKEERLEKERQEKIKNMRLQAKRFSHDSK